MRRASVQTLRGTSFFLFVRAVCMYTGTRTSRWPAMHLPSVVSVAARVRFGSGW